jgi:hypothetical protein
MTASSSLNSASVVATAEHTMQKPGDLPALPAGLVWKGFAILFNKWSLLYVFKTFMGSQI